jgi:hypothetical protein
MTSLIAFCSCHAASTIFVRLGPTPGTSAALHLLVDDPQDVAAKVRDHTLSHDRADALDQPGSQITLNSLDGCWQDGRVGPHLELPAVTGMRRPSAGQPKTLADLSTR